MNRHIRRAEAFKRRKIERQEAIRLAHQVLFTSTDPTISGATLFLPDGEVVYLSADDARAMAGRGPGRGRAS